MSLHEIISLGLLAIIIFLFQKKYVSTEDNIYFGAGITLKIIAGILIGLLFSTYYKMPSADTFRFHLGLMEFRNVLYNNPFEAISIFFSTEKYSHLFKNHEIIEIPRVAFFIKTLFLISIFSSSNYWILSAWLSCISLFASVLLINQLRQFTNSAAYTYWISFVFFPSFLLWSSGLLKETLTWTCISIIIAIYLKFRSNHQLSIIHWILVFILLFILFELKYYYFGSLIASLIFTVTFTIKDGINNSAILKIVKITSPILFIIAIDQLVPQMGLDTFLKTIVENHDLTVSSSVNSDNYGDYIHFRDLNPTLASIFYNAPLALISALFRPFIWEANGPLQIILSIQNLFVLIFAASRLVCLLRRKSENQKSIPSTLYWGMLFYILINAILLAIASPNFGALERYKSGFYPFFVFLILYKNPLWESISATFSQLTKKA